MQPHAHSIPTWHVQTGSYLSLIHIYDGSLIYVVDGLPSDSDDFRHPGDEIEGEIVPELERALADERVYPTDIKDTGWGYVFVSYYPIHENDQVIRCV